MAGAFERFSRMSDAVVILLEADELHNVRCATHSARHRFIHVHARRMDGDLPARFGIASCVHDLRSYQCGL